MSSWKDALRNTTHQIESRFDQLRYRLKQRLQLNQPIQIVPYNSFGNHEILHIRGRVFEQKKLPELEQTDRESVWNNLLAAYQRFESDEVPNLELTIRINEASATTRTDEEGYFDCALPTPAGLEPDTLWHPLTVRTTAPENKPDNANAPVSAPGQVMLPSPDTDFGIISDIDDTIMLTNATSLLEMARLTFLRSAASRLPFAGVAPFYQALVNSGKVSRPLFYVSSSPWNLYDFLLEFMEINTIPPGVLLLRDFGLNHDQWFQSSHHQHKLSQIRKVMDTYPELPFILIGDSGQHDPEIYSEIVAQRPQQVKSIYIRDVSPAAERDNEVQALARQTRAHGIDLLLVQDTLAAARHAQQQGYIGAEAIAAIQAGMT